MKKVKSLLWRYAPPLAAKMRRGRSGLGGLTQAFVDHYGYRVLTGPFAGLEYVPEAVGSAFLPKLIGSYERELHGVIDEIVRHNCRTIVDIGSAEGYYAVGLARLMPQSQIYAFDIDGDGRRLCKAMARLNKVSARVAVEAECDAARLNALIKDSMAPTLIICDCEGCEYDLLKIEAVPELRHAFLLVELHVCENCPSPAEFAAQFEFTHRRHDYAEAPRAVADYPELEVLPADQRALALNEFRNNGQQWVFLEPLAIVGDAATPS